MDKLLKNINGIIFIIFLSLVFIFNGLIKNKTFSESENRRLEQKPEFSMKKLIFDKYTSQYEKYISDQFLMRDFWISFKWDYEKLIGKKESNGVYYGKDGFLMERFKKNDNKDLEEKLEAINSFSSSNKVNTYMLLAPNSGKILEEKLPKYAYNDDELVYIEEVKGGLNKDIKFVDVYKALADKSQEYIFYKTDHHWTSKGAYYAYKTLGESMNFTAHNEEYFNINRVTEDFYGSLYSKGGFRNLKPDSIDLYMPKAKEQIQVDYIEENKQTNSLYNLDNLNKKDKYTVFLDSNHPLVKITTENKEGKKLLIVKDSYANSFVPFLTSHFSEIYMVDLRYYSDSLNSLIKDKGIEEVLLLYNVSTFNEDPNVKNINE